MVLALRILSSGFYSKLDDRFAAVISLICMGKAELENLLSSCWEQFQAIKMTTTKFLAKHPDI
ncbi:MAG: hypothetical protein H6Q67_1402 [Firmicutes bacterium]|nr:hypothetical protein [Bacillota bacterium]